MTSPGSSPAQQPDRAPSGNIGADDPRYAALLGRGFNKRFDGRPDYFRLVGSTEATVDAVQHAVRNGLRMSVRSGGHCLEGFVGDPEVRVVIDMSQMTGVCYDPTMKAFSVEAGTTLGEMHRRLFIGWGVVLPVGQSPDIGIGGHALGSAFGFLHRKHGLAGDHLYAVEVVVVDADGVAKSVIATREPSDPNRELWWAHTGAGGGNFGIVTRYWFRSHDTHGSDPSSALPRAPASVVTSRAEWNWSDIDATAFASLIRNYGEWCERNSDADSQYATMFSALIAGPRQDGAKIALRTMSIDGANGENHFDQHVAAVAAGVKAPVARETTTVSWLSFALNPFPDLFFIGPGGTSASQVRLKIKDALLRTRHTDRQIAVMYDYLTRPNLAFGGGIGLATYGGRINSVASDATAASQRASVMDTSCSAGWMNRDDDTRNLAWVRELYRDVFAESGGVPVPGPQSEGSLITHPDADFADPAWNTSGVPWHTMYYNDNYPRLQQVKAKWDPRNVFHHALSIQLPRS